MEGEDKGEEIDPEEQENAEKKEKAEISDGETASPKVASSVAKVVEEEAVSLKMAGSVAKSVNKEMTSPKAVGSVAKSVLDEETTSPIVPGSVTKAPSIVKSKSRSVASEMKSPPISHKSPSPKSPLSERRTSFYSEANPIGTSKISQMDGLNEPEKDQVAEILSKASGGKANSASVRLTSGSANGAGGGGGSNLHNANFPGVGSFPCAVSLLHKRSPFIHDPPQPEERRARIQCPRTPKEYIINLREDLADFQESHGLPRTRDYSFLSLGLALAQETGRAIYSVFLMFTELFPILAIVSLILRFALDKLIEILETTETAPKVKKSIIFALEMLAIMIPLWILIGTIIIPLITLIFSILKRMLRIKGGRKKTVVKSKQKIKTDSCSFF